MDEKTRLMLEDYDSGDVCDPKDLRDAIRDLVEELETAKANLRSKTKSLELSSDESRRLRSLIVEQTGPDTEERLFLCKYEEHDGIYLTVALGGVTAENSPTGKRIGMSYGGVGLHLVFHDKEGEHRQVLVSFSQVLGGVLEAYGYGPKGKKR